MNDVDRKILMEIHSKSEVTASVVKRIIKVLDGNGQIGLVQDYSITKHNQLACIKQREKDAKNLRWKIGISVTILSVLISVITSITYIFLNK